MVSTYAVLDIDLFSPFMYLFFYFILFWFWFFWVLSHLEKIFWKYPAKLAIFQATFS